MKSYEQQIEFGDHLVLATEGVTAVLGGGEIADMVCELKEPQKIVEAILNAIETRPRQYRDDRSMVVVRM